MTICEQDIVFGESEYMSHTARYQDILFNGIAIGALITGQQGWLEPLKEVYQFGTAKPIPKGLDYFESEDGPEWNIITTYTLDNFIKAHKLIYPAFN